MSQEESAASANIVVRNTDEIVLDLAKVAAKQQQQQKRTRIYRRLLLVLQEHPWWSALILVLTLAGLTAVILLPICATHCCPSMPIGNVCNSNDQVPEPPGVPRLLLQFVDPNLDALSVLPAVLRPYTNRTLINSSNLQILDFLDQDTYNAARNYLSTHSDLIVMVRDYLMKRFPLNTDNVLSDLNASINVINQISPLLNGVTANGTDATPINNNDTSALEDLLSGIFSNSNSAGRRLQQTQTSYNGRVVPYGANDPYIRNRNQWFHSRVQADMAWLVSKGASNVVVAIIDTGADLNHQDLKGSLWVNTAEVAGNGVDDDGNGFVDDVNGWDFAGACLSSNPDGSCNKCGGRSTPMDVDGHGTHVAGIVAATQDNFLGGSGVAPQVKLMILRVSDCIDGSIYASAVASAYDYALRMGAHVVQCSFGMSYPNYFSPTNAAPWYYKGWNQAYVSAITPLQQKGILVVAAAGNEYLDLDQLYDQGYSYNPCLCPLSNVMCVGATDANDTITPFSNTGVRTVHVAAPGLAIFSTVPNDAYMSLSGTSMAAPIVTGTAATALAILGAATGNYYQSQQLKSMLMATVDVVPGLPVVSGGRVNAFSMALAALKFAAESVQGGTSLVLVQPALSASAQLPVSLQGFSETYITVQPGSWGTPLANITDDQVIDVSSRVGPSLFPTFKYSTAGTGVVLTAYLQLTTIGLYSVQVSVGRTTATSLAGDTQLFLAGKRIYLSSGGVGTFQVGLIGYFSFELQVSLPNTQVQVAFKAPGGFFPQTSSSFYAVANQALTAAGVPDPGTVPASSSSSFQPVGLELVQGWQVNYNITPAAAWNVTTVLGSTAAAASSAGALQYLTLLPDLAATYSSALATSLLTGAAAAAVPASSASSAAVVGVATARLRALPTAQSFTLRATCTRCMVWLDGLLVLDVWEGLSRSAPITKLAGCTSVPPKVGAVLTVAFAGASLASAQVALTWAPGCPSTRFVSMAGSVVSSNTWQPAANQAGQIGGLQCDVWLSASLPPPRQYQVLPVGAVAADAPAYKIRTTAGIWFYTVQTLFPGTGTVFPTSAAPPHLFSVRCWTYIAASQLPTIANLGIVMPGGTVAGTANATATLRLAGNQIWPVASGPASPQSAGPTITATGSWSLLLVAEWESVNVHFPMSVVTTLGVPITVSTAAMTLPLSVQGPQAGSFNPSLRVAGVGPAGHLSTTRLPSSTLDVPEQVEYAQAALPVVGTFSSPAFGLDGLFFYSGVLGSLTRYTQADGYLAASASGAQSYTLRMLDDVATSTSIVMAPGISIVNARVFATSNGQAAQTVQVFLPSGYYYTEAIVKTARPDGKTPIYVDILAPAAAAGQVDASVWYRPSAA